jgi:hypothetical protein
MGSRIFHRLRGRRGTTLVEVIAAVLILAIVVTAVLTGIGFSQRTILSQSSQGDAAAQAQDLADSLIARLHGADDIPDTVGEAVRVDSDTFPDAGLNHDEQYCITSVHDDILSGDDNEDVSGYRIKVAVAYRDSTGRKFVQLSAFAAKEGDDG